MSSLVRCAIYTRKSTEEGLDQAYNSLNAQREACEAYVMSQAGEGWLILPTFYDDGGFSGGNLDRPALQTLLSDIDKGLVDVVVVYKIDRLTRALTDFARLVERFDKRNVSFVSVTQAFSTTTSMGRLTLNVLLSFAQFERELTTERIRDKFAASRRRGIFMGGNPPLGYDPKDRKLIVNEQEAETVRFIFNRYLELKSVGKLRADLEQKSIRSKLWTSAKGNTKGGGSWYVGSLTHFLRNRVYVGDAVHKDEVFPGEHEPIISRELFDQVQSQLDTNRINYRKKTTIESANLLTGLIFDDRGNSMSPKTARKPGNKAYTYYVSQAQIQQRDTNIKPTRPLAAQMIEGLARDRLLRVLAALDIIKANQLPDIDLRQLVRRYVSRVEAGKMLTTIQFDAPSLSEDSKLPIDQMLDRLTLITVNNESLNLRDRILHLTIEGALARSGGDKSIAGWDANNWTAPRRKINPSIVKALARAHLWRDMIENGQVTTIDELARNSKVERKQVRTMLRLAFLAPDIQRALLTGQLPQSLTLTSLLDMDLPVSWADQRRLLGIH
ncbi:MAG: recombinase family protein [Parvibaculum sp.]|nr:recombinase family protein [Parvibaculum sp.]